ncbi:unnamed protein product [Gordionus sp. m RMFG-2023]
MIIYYSLIWRNTRSTKRENLIKLIYEISQELIGKFIIITIMGYFIISISKGMKDKRWLIDKKHRTSIINLPIMITSKNQVQASDLGGIYTGKISKDLDRKAFNKKNKLVIENNYDIAQMEIIVYLTSRHYYNWNREFFLTLLRVFLMEALIIVMPLSLMQLTHKFWIKRINILHLNYLFTDFQLINLVTIILPFPLTLAIMMCS